MKIRCEADSIQLKSIEFSFCMGYEHTFKSIYFDLRFWKYMFYFDILFGEDSSTKTNNYSSDFPSPIVLGYESMLPTMSNLHWDEEDQYLVNDQKKKD